METSDYNFSFIIEKLISTDMTSVKKVTLFFSKNFVYFKVILFRYNKLVLALFLILEVPSYYLWNNIEHNYNTVFGENKRH